MSRFAAFTARAFVALFVVPFVACGGGGDPPKAPDPGDTCRVSLAPPSGTPERTAPPAPFDVPRSLLIANIDVPLAMVTNEIEKQVPTRVAEEHDVDLGIAGHLEYTVDRGAVSAHIDGDALIVEAPLVGHANACARGNCYAGCNPEARFSARIPLHLDHSFALHTAGTHVDVTRGCKVQALGGALTVDATPAIASRLPDAEKRLSSEIDRRLPNFRADAEETWRKLSEPRALPLGACVVLAPEGIVQGRASRSPAGEKGGGTNDTARLHLGLRARPELRGQCGDPPRVTKLPPLEDDDALPQEGDVHLAVVFAESGAASMIEGADVPFTSAHARVRAASGTVGALDLRLGGGTCGEIRAAATGAAWNSDGRSVHLTSTSLYSGETARLTSASLDEAPLLRAIENAQIPVPIAPHDLATMLPELAKSASDARANVSARISQAEAESAGIAGEHVVAVIHARGALDVAAKAP